ncbi:MAG: oligosaccharide flippase family protein, partial [Bacteroidota bacterium]
VPKSASVATFKSVLGYGKWTWLSSTILIFNAHTDKWIVSAILGLKVFGYYSIGVSVLNQLKTIFTSSVSWIFPKISSGKLSDKEKASMHLKLTLFASLIGLVTSFVLVKIDFFFLMWLGKETFENSKLFLHLFLFLLPVWLISSASFYYLLGLGIVKKKFYADLFVFLTKITVTFVALLKLDYERWPILFVIPIMIELLLFTVLVHQKSKLKLLYVALFVLFNLLVLTLRFNNIL